MQTRRKFITGMLGATGAALLARSAAGPTPRWQIGCYTRPWAQYDYRVALDGIAAAGFKYAGLMTARSPRLVISVETTIDEAVAIGEEARQRGLELSSVYGGGFPVKDSIDAGIAGLKRLIDNSTGPQCRRILERVGHPNLRLWYDPGNIYFYSDGKLDPVDDAATVDGLVAGMSVKDFRPPKEVNVTPGTGQVDFPRVFARLKRGGFTGGPLIVETLAADATDIVAEAKKARQFLEGLTITSSA